MNIHAYTHDNKNLLIEETEARFETINADNFAKAVLMNIEENAQEWNEEVTDSDEVILKIAKRYFEEYINIEE